MYTTKDRTVLSTPVVRASKRNPTFSVLACSGDLHMEGFYNYAQLDAKFTTEKKPVSVSYC